MAWNFHYDLQHIVIFWTESAKKGAPDLMIYNVSGTRFRTPAFSSLAQWILDILKSKNRVPKVLRFTMFAEPFSAKSAKKGAPDLMIYNVSGTSFWKVGMLTWCNGIPSFSKVKKGVPKTYWIIMFAGPFSAKSAKKGAPDLMIYNVSGTRFSEVVFLTWSQWILAILKSKNGVPKVLRFTMFGELFSAKSSKKHPSELGI